MTYNTFSTCNFFICVISDIFCIFLPFHAIHSVYCNITFVICQDYSLPDLMQWSLIDGYPCLLDFHAGGPVVSMEAAVSPEI